ncbi:hypothetical protein C7U72_09710 [Escherichia coli]|nr:hypothetical protein C7U72_09710 [Escherichia coli]PSX57478.1 hypothetical protein C7U83_02710 [Escherichia coli]
MFYESCHDVDKKRMKERPGHLCNRNSNNFIFTENIFLIFIYRCWLLFLSIWLNCQKLNYLKFIAY